MFQKVGANHEHVLKGIGTLKNGFEYIIYDNKSLLHERKRTLAQLKKVESPKQKRKGKLDSHSGYCVQLH